MSSRPALLKPSIPSSPMPTMDSHRGDGAGCRLESSASGMRKHILILGGTMEARECGELLARRSELDVTLSLAGRTASPAAQPVPVRRGGFGGVAGLVQYLRDAGIYALIDATHPYGA